MNQVNFFVLALAFATVQRSKHFAENPLEKSTVIRIEMNKFYCCKESAM